MQLSDGTPLKGWLHEADLGHQISRASDASTSKAPIVDTLGSLIALSGRWCMFKTFPEILWYN